MALLSVYIEPQGFDPLNSAPGGVNADEATPEQLASAFSETYGPFTSVQEVEAHFGHDRTVTVQGPKGKFQITADVIRDENETVVDNELEIFAVNEGMKALTAVNSLVENSSDVVPVLANRPRNWKQRLHNLRARRGENMQESDNAEWDRVQAEVRANPRWPEIRTAASNYLVSQGSTEVGSSDINHAVFALYRTYRGDWEQVIADNPTPQRSEREPGSEMDGIRREWDRHYGPAGRKDGYSAAARRAMGWNESTVEKLIDDLLEGDGEPGFDLPPVQQVFLRPSAHNAGWIEAVEILDDGARHKSIGQFRTPSQFQQSYPDAEIVRNFTQYPVDVPAAEPAGPSETPSTSTEPVQGQPGATGACTNCGSPDHSEAECPGSFNDLEREGKKHRAWIPTKRGETGA